MALPDNAPDRFKYAFEDVTSVPALQVQIVDFVGTVSSPRTLTARETALERLHDAFDPMSTTDAVGNPAVRLQFVTAFNK